MSSHTASDILSLWVMRLNRPVFVKQQCEPAELYLDDIAGSLTFSDAGVRSDLDGVPLHRLSMASISSASVDPTPTVAGDRCQANSSNSQDPDDIIRVKVGGPGELLHLPQSFGSTYLGETFSAHVNLYNESNYLCRNVELKISLHNRVEWITLYNNCSFGGTSISALSPSRTDSSQRSATGSLDLSPGQSLNAVIHHELKELGVHTLRCTASCFLASSTSSDSSAAQQGVTSPVVQHSGIGDHSMLEPFVFQRFYRFPVIKPLDVKKNFSAPERDGSVFMEAQVQNLTSYPIYLERVAFEPNPNLIVTDLNSVGTSENLLPCGQLNFLRPDGIRQLLYRLTPVPGAVLQQHAVASAKLSSTTPVVSHQVMTCTDSTLNVASPNPPISAGRLDITWRSTMGERGRLQTSSLKYELPNISDLQLKSVELPDATFAEQPFKIVLELFNRSARHLDLLLNLPSDFARCASPLLLPSWIWIGSTTRPLGGLPPRRSVILSLDAIATTPGLQAIPGPIVRDCSSNQDFEFNDLGHVLVCPS